MKKSSLILLVSLTVVSLSAFGLTQRNKRSCAKEVAHSSPTVFFLNTCSKPNAPVDVHYAVETRFTNTVTMQRLQNATSIVDIFPNKTTRIFENYNETKVSILFPEGEIVASGESEMLNEAQLSLIKTMGHSTNILIEAICSEKNTYTGELEDYQLVYYMTVVPESQAQYAEGQEALVKFIRDGSRSQADMVRRGGLQPGKVAFVVSSNGTIGEVILESTCGYSELDEKMVQLISEVPGEWLPAIDHNGEKVDQTLVLFFGMRGC